MIRIEENAIMKRVYLFCDQGMSTSLLASRMQDCADKHLLPIEILAFSNKNIRDIVAKKHPDVILLGPQVKYLFPEMKRQFDTEAPVMLIDQDDYGMMDGERVLKKALILLKERKNKQEKETSEK